MGRYVTVSTWVDVDVDLSEIDTQDLIDALEDKGEYTEGLDPLDLKEVVDRLYQKRRLGRPYEKEIDDIIFYVIGRI